MTEKHGNLYWGSPLITPSILSADFGRLKDEVECLERAGVDGLHLDIMDGHFVPNLTFGPAVVETIRKSTVLPLACHLMVSRPEIWISPFIDAGADLLIVHCEATHELYRVIQKIKKGGIQCGVALSPATPLAMIEEVLDAVDIVLVMSVEPGFGGQVFISSTYGKIERLSKIRKNLRFLIGVDGGVSSVNLKHLHNTGGDLFVIGSAIYASEDRTVAVRELKKQLELG